MGLLTVISEQNLQGQRQSTSVLSTGAREQGWLWLCTCLGASWKHLVGCSIGLEVAPSSHPAPSLGGWLCWPWLPPCLNSVSLSQTLIYQRNFRKGKSYKIKHSPPPPFSYSPKNPLRYWAAIFRPMTNLLWRVPAIRRPQFTNWYIEERDVSAILILLTHFPFGAPLCLGHCLRMWANTGPFLCGSAQRCCSPGNFTQQQLLTS